MPPRELLAIEAGGMRGKDNINPMVWTGRRKTIQHRHHPGVITCWRERALKTAYQTNSESGKEVTRLTPKRCRSRLFSVRLDIVVMSW